MCVHLAGGLQFAGGQSVIATTGIVDDRATAATTLRVENVLKKVDLENAWAEELESSCFWRKKDKTRVIIDYITELRRITIECCLNQALASRCKLDTK